MTTKRNKIAIENVNHPGAINNVDADKYHDMRNALLAVIPQNGGGLTHKEMTLRVKPLLSETLFPGGQTALWWSKTVQLDLEAKGLLVRKDTKPLRWVQA